MSEVIEGVEQVEQMDPCPICGDSGEYAHEASDCEDASYCENCEETVHVQDTTSVTVGYRSKKWCDVCVRHDTFECVRCNEPVSSNGDYRWVNDDEQACVWCVDANASFCDECDEYRWDDDESHTCGQECGCEAEKQNFSLPVVGIRQSDGGVIGGGVGKTYLRNDERMTVESPDELISDAGLSRICEAIRVHYMKFYAAYDRAYHAYNYPHRTDYNPEGLSVVELRVIRDEASKAWTAACLERDTITCRVDEIGAEWKTDRGTFPKRLKSAVYKQGQIKIDEDLLAKIGQIAREYSAPLAESVEITRDLNMDAEDFYHEDSCWWGEYKHSRCTLKSNHGFGIRTFGMSGNVTGRAWAIPMEWSEGKFTPTASNAPDAYVVFNGYGALTERAAPRVASIMFGGSSREVSVYGMGDWRMYINSEKVYLIASPDLHTEIEGTERNLRDLLPRFLYEH